MQPNSTVYLCLSRGAHIVCTPGNLSFPFKTPEFQFQTPWARLGVSGSHLSDVPTVNHGALELDRKSDAFGRGTCGGSLRHRITKGGMHLDAGGADGRENEEGHDTIESQVTGVLDMDGFRTLLLSGLSLHVYMLSHVCAYAWVRAHIKSGCDVAHTYTRTHKCACMDGRAFANASVASRGGD